MWDVKQFEAYLSSIGHPNAFKDIIYPGMKECILGTILMHHDNLDKRKNSFELYGSDFMITEDFQPWLIEINSHPALYASTPVTSRLSPQVLEDVIKVVIDYAKNTDSKVGQFELLYKENIPKLPEFKNEPMLKGQPLPISYFRKPDEGTKTVAVQMGTTTDFKMHRHIMAITTDLRNTLQNLLSIINAERERRECLHTLALQTSEVEEIYKNKTLLLDEPKYTSTLALQQPDTIEVIKSIANNLRVTEGLVRNMKGIKSDTYPIKTKRISAEVTEDYLFKPPPKSVRSENQRGIFTTLMNSLRNLTFINKTTNINEV